MRLHIEDGTTLTNEDAKSAIENLPEGGATVEITENANTSRGGDEDYQTTIKVKITDKDGNVTENVEIPVYVRHKPYITKYPLRAKDMIVFVNDTISEELLKKHATVYDKVYRYMDKKSIPTTDEPKEAEAVVHIVYKDGTDQTLTIPVTVLPLPGATPIEKKVGQELTDDEVKAAVTNLPNKGETLIVESKPSTNVAGDFEAKVKVTYSHGAVKTVKVPVKVKYEATVTDINCKEGHKVDVPELKEHITNLPDGAEVEIVTEPDTTQGLDEDYDTEAVVKITKDGVVVQEEVTIPVHVKHKVDWTDITPIPEVTTTPVVIYKGDTVKYEDAITDLPEGASVTLVDPDKGINNAELGEQKTKVKVTFKDGSSRIVEVTFTVKDRVDWTDITPIPEVTTETVTINVDITTISLMKIDTVRILGLTLSCLTIYRLLIVIQTVILLKAQLKFT